MTSSHEATHNPQAEMPETRSWPPPKKRPVNDLICYCKEYAQERPEVAALWCFGIGFVLGWKLKPW